MASHWISQVCIFAVLGYRRWLSPLLPPRCRFFPSCSEYALTCLQQEKTPLRALGKIGKRIVRCNPFHPGGVDLP